MFITPDVVSKSLQTLNVPLTTLYKYYSLIHVSSPTVYLLTTDYCAAEEN